MPSLDSPLVPLAALYLAGSSRKGRQYTAGLTGKNMLAGSFGAASAEWAGNTVTNAVGMGGTVTPELSQALVGAGLSKYGDMVPQNDAMASGIMFNVGAQAMQNLGVTAGDLFGDLTGGGGQQYPGSPQRMTEDTSSSESVETSTTSTTETETLTADGVTF